MVNNYRVSSYELTDESSPSQFSAGRRTAGIHGPISARPPPRIVKCTDCYFFRWFPPKTPEPCPCPFLPFRRCFSFHIGDRMAEFGEAFCAVVWRVNTGSEQELGKTEWDHNDLFVTAKEGDHCCFFLSLSISFFSQYFVDYSSSSASGKDAYIRKDFRSVALVINLCAMSVPALSVLIVNYPVVREKLLCPSSLCSSLKRSTISQSYLLYAGSFCRLLSQLHLYLARPYPKFSLLPQHSCLSVFLIAPM